MVLVTVRVLAAASRSADGEIEDRGYGLSVLPASRALTSESAFAIAASLGALASRSQEALAGLYPKAQSPVHICQRS